MISSASTPTAGVDLKPPGTTYMAAALQMGKS
jgi:hypothetical protein